MHRFTNGLKPCSAIVCCVAVVFLLLACNGSGGEDTAVQKGGFDETVAQLTTPEVLSIFMQRNILYTSPAQRIISQQHGYSWKTPQVTYADGYGFCYDLSAFALYCLLENGYDDARIMFACYGDWGNKSSSGHMVAYFSRDGKYWTINNGSLNGPFDDLNQVINDASWGRSVITHRIFTYAEIPFGIEYMDMDYFCY